MGIGEGAGGLQPQEVIVVALKNDDPGYKALKWSLDQYGSQDDHVERTFLLLHVVSEVVSFADGRLIPVGDASQQEVAEHVCEQVLPFMETLQDACDEKGATSSIEVVKSEKLAEAIIDAAARLRGSKLILGSASEVRPGGTVAECLQPENQPPGCSVLVVTNGQVSHDIPAKGELPPPHNAGSGLNSSVLGLVEDPEFRSSTESGENKRENWQKKQALRSGAMQPRTDFKFPNQKELSNGNHEGNGEANKGEGGGEGEPSALQLARMAYRQVNQKAVHPESDNGSAEAAQQEGAEESGAGPVELALPPPSVTRSSKMSGKLLASQKLMSGKLTGGGGGGSMKPPVPKGGKLDPKVREQKEQQASNSIRVSLGRGIPILKIQKSHFIEYSLGALQTAMDHYWPNHILGEGSYGIVYRGLLNGLEVAIKQLKNPDQKAAMEEIDREIEVQKRCDHQNLVKLLGYSVEDRSLVYEYLSQGSLEDRLLCMGGSPPLLWPDRCRIAMEVAAALQHLHSRPPPIVHRDVKPANVLLDENFVAKLGDVGLARLMEDMPNGNTHIVRKSVIVGTEHYVDPEYLCARRGYLGPKSDVYSFGIVLLQLLVGGIPNLRKIDMAVEREELAGLLDPKAGDWPIPLAMDLANLGLWCSEMDRKDRPDLEEEVIPALLEICEAAAMEVMAQEEKKRKVQEEEKRKNEEALRILEEEKAAVAAKAAQESKEREEKAAATAAAAARAAATSAPAQQQMSKSANNAPAAPAQPASSSGGGCC